MGHSLTHTAFLPPGLATVNLKLKRTNPAAKTKPKKQRRTKMDKPIQCLECWKVLPEHAPKCSKGVKVAEQLKAHKAKRKDRWGDQPGFQEGAE